jgi:hypothetical protein
MIILLIKLPKLFGFRQDNPFISLVEKKHQVQSIYLEAKSFRLWLKPWTTIRHHCKTRCRFILPDNYLLIVQHFEENQRQDGRWICLHRKNGDWILENKKDHIRGAFKAYQNLFFKQMGGLKAAMGWDTVDELLSFYGWK